MSRKTLRAVGDDERGRKPMTLIEAVEGGDPLDLLLAQRRLIAESLTKAGDSVRPQLSNELTKLNALIAAERARTEAEAEEAAGRGERDESFDPAAI